jgi:DNA modification methylase
MSLSYRILAGDVRVQLQTLPAGSARCCVTSPPYWGLRDYGHAGQLGLEATPEAYVSAIVEVFAEVRRVLADDGTLWLNLGDSYAGSGRGGSVGGSSGLEGSPAHQEECRKARGSQLAAGLHESARQAGAVGRAWVPPPPGLKQKDLVGIPWMVAFPEKLIVPCVLAGSAPGDTVLDPFTGSGTTGAVALRLGRSFVGCELNPEYVKLAERRIGGVAPLFAERAV